MDWTWHIFSIVRYPQATLGTDYENNIIICNQGGAWDLAHYRPQAGTLVSLKDRAKGLSYFVSHFVLNLF